MLNLDNPKSDLIFQASAYTGKIKLRCHKYVVQDFLSRQETFDEMEWFCWELIDFSNEYFKKEHLEIKELAGLIIDKINQLRVIDVSTDQGNCTVCNGKLNRMVSSIPEVADDYSCSKCPMGIFHYLNQIDDYTGASAI